MTAFQKHAQFGLFLLCIFGYFTAGNGATVILTPLAQQYVPYEYETSSSGGSEENGIYGINMDAVESSSYDVTTGLVYAGGKLAK